MELESKTQQISINPLCNININFKIKDEPIFFQKDALCTEKFILYCSETSIYTIEHNPESTSELITFKIDYIKTPSNRPTLKIVQMADMSSLYQDSNVLDKQNITLDPLYRPGTPEQTLDSKIIHICFTKWDLYSENIVAVVTNYGQCEIVKINFTNNDWNNTILQINELWNEIFPITICSTKVFKTYHNIRNYIEDYTITSCCWLDKIVNLNEGILFCATISGWIVIIKIIKHEQTWLMKFQFKYKSNLYKINNIQSYSYKMKSGEHKTILVCGDIKGRIKVFKFNENDKQLIEIYNLWKTEDHMSSKRYSINYCVENDLLFLTTCKSSHFLLFVLSANDDNKRIFSKSVFCDIQITGFDTINPYEYIICTANGCTKLLKIVINKENINFITSLTNIANDFETENNILFGMLATPNKVGWMFLFYPHRIYIPTQNIKNFGYISVYTLNIMNPLQILKNIPIEKYSEFEMYNDCKEIIRLKIQKNILNENYSKFCIEPIEINEQFLHRLRIKLLIIQGFGNYNLRKVKNRGTNNELEKNNIILTIITISAYLRLEYLKKLNKFQMQTIKCLTRILQQYLAANLSEYYVEVRNILKNNIENILKNTTNIVQDFKENCFYCKQNVDLPSDTCAHNFSRCCISLVQIMDIKTKYCKICKSTALNDDTFLKDILFENEKLRCTLCNIPFI